MKASFADEGQPGSSGFFGLLACGAMPHVKHDGCGTSWVGWLLHAIAVAEPSMHIADGQSSRVLRAMLSRDLPLHGKRWAAPRWAAPAPCTLCLGCSPAPVL